MVDRKKVARAVARFQCRVAIDALFEQHGPAAILEALARRLRDEAGIAGGEGRTTAALRWSVLADDIELLGAGPADDGAPTEAQP